MSSYYTCSCGMRLGTHICGSTGMVAYATRSNETQPAVLLRDTAEDRERLIAGVKRTMGGQESFTSDQVADAILAALRGSDGGGA